MQLLRIFRHCLGILAVAKDFLLLLRFFVAAVEDFLQLSEISWSCLGFLGVVQDFLQLLMIFSLLLWILQLLFSLAS